MTKITYLNDLQPVTLQIGAASKPRASVIDAATDRDNAWLGILPGFEMRDISPCTKQLVKLCGSKVFLVSYADLNMRLMIRTWKKAFQPHPFHFPEQVLDKNKDSDAQARATKLLLPECTQTFQVFF